MGAEQELHAWVEGLGLWVTAADYRLFVEAAANSPCCSKAVRIGGFHLGDDEHTARMATRRGRQAPRSRQPTVIRARRPPRHRSPAERQRWPAVIGCAAVRARAMRPRTASRGFPGLTGSADGRPGARRAAGRRHLAAPLVKCDSPSKAHSWEVRSVIHVSAQHIFPSHP
jgi:hypothetical protein